MFEKVQDWWKNATYPLKIIFLGGAFLFVILLSIVFHFSTRPNMKLLFGELVPADQGKVISELEKLGIECTYNEQGNIYVSEDRVAEARAKLASAGKFPGRDHNSIENLEHFGMMHTPRVEQEKLKSITEGELSRSIEMINGVRSARVHLNLGEDSPFISERKPASASIHITEDGKDCLRREQSKTIAQMVANAVLGLDINHVTVVSNNGYTLWNGNYKKSREQAEQKIRAEAEEGKRREHDLQQVLDKTFGVGNTVAMVHITMDFEKIPRRESHPPSIKTSKYYKNNEHHKTFSLPETGNHHKEVVGVIVSMSISVLADQSNIKDLKKLESFLKGYLGPYYGNPYFTATVTPVVFDRKTGEKENSLILKQETSHQTAQYFLKLLLPLMVSFLGFVIFQIFIRTRSSQKKGKQEAPASLLSSEESNLLPQEAFNSRLPLPQGFKLVDTASNPYHQIVNVMQSTPFSFLKRVEPIELVTLLQDEHPQTVALVLSYLPVQQASAIMVRLPHELQEEIALRIASMNQIPLDVIQEIELILQKKILRQGSKKKEMASLGGPHAFT